MRKPFLFIFVIFVIFVIVSFGAGFVYGKNVTAKNQGNGNEYQKGWKALKERIISSGIIQNQDIISSFLGDVYQKEGNKIFINLSYVDPLLDEYFDSRVVTVDDNTEIYMMIEKNGAEYQQEMEEYLQEKTNRGPDGADGAPVLFVKEIKTLDDVFVGKRITVKTDQNIKNKKEFIAKEIIIQ